MTCSQIFAGTKNTSPTKVGLTHPKNNSAAYPNRSADQKPTTRKMRDGAFTIYQEETLSQKAFSAAGQGKTRKTTKNTYSGSGMIPSPASGGSWNCMDDTGWSGFAAVKSISFCRCLKSSKFNIKRWKNTLSFFM
jgi:hypothetical protein